MRRALLLAMAVTALMAASTTTANAQQDFYVQDPVTMEECGELVIDGNDVSGGCLDEDWMFSFSIGDPNSTWRFCAGYADIRIDATGSLYAVNQTNYMANTLCSQTWTKACEDEATSETLPWPGELRLGEDPGEMEIEIEQCLESGGPGGIHGESSLTFAVTFDQPGGDWIRELEQTSPAPAPGTMFWGEWTNSESVQELFITH